MKTIFTLIALLILLSINSFAQKNFLLKDASKTYDVNINIAKCDGDICEGKSTVSFTKKGENAVFQTVQMPNMYLELGENKKPTANLVELYGENNSGVIFDDFNFDGIDDVALRNGNNGAYGGPSYDVYLAVVPSRKFVKNAELTALASQSLGLFNVDKKAKLLETFTKDGCCYHETTRYSVINNRPKKVYVFTEDAQKGDGSKVFLTRKTLVKGKWVTKTETKLTKDYYKED